MVWELCRLIFLTLGAFGSSSNEQNVSARTGIIPEKLDLLAMNLKNLTGLMEVLRADVEAVKRNQESLRGDQQVLLDQLQAFENSSECCSQAPTCPSYKSSHYKDCQQLMTKGFNKSGTYWVSPYSVREIRVYCEQQLDGGGWTVLQQRKDGSVDFFRDWADYKTGFGNLSGEFWLGNDNIHLFTKGYDQKLKIELKSPGGQTVYADYSSFWINDESLKYRLHVAGYSRANPPGDSFGVHTEHEFSTRDSDQDGWHLGHCAKEHHGGWWYTKCLRSNLNGAFGGSFPWKAIQWLSWKGRSVSLRGTRMMIKTKF